MQQQQNIPILCSACGKKTSAENFSTIWKCSRCKLAYYCDKKCQMADWPVHKLHCKEQLAAAIKEVATAEESELLSTNNDLAHRLAKVLSAMFSASASPTTQPVDAERLNHALNLMNTVISMKTMEGTPPIALEIRYKPPMKLAKKVKDNQLFEYVEACILKLYLSSIGEEERKALTSQMAKSDMGSLDAVTKLESPHMSMSIVTAASVQDKMDDPNALVDGDPRKSKRWMSPESRRVVIVCNADAKEGWDHMIRLVF